MVMEASLHAVRGACDSAAVAHVGRRGDNVGDFGERAMPTTTPMLWRAAGQANTSDAAGANAAATDEQSRPVVTKLTGGRYLLAWEDHSTQRSEIGRASCRERV